MCPSSAFTGSIEQAQRIMSPELQQGIPDGAPTGCTSRARMPDRDCLYGAVAPEAIEAIGFIGESRRDIGLLAITSADRLHAGWTAARSLRHDRLGVQHPSHIEKLLVGSVRGHRVEALGVEQFGQTGTVADLYRRYGIHAGCDHRCGGKPHHRRADRPSEDGGVVK
ncbi:hypothetical protein XI08_10890 [Bradyrhizobium sp. CCBAU 11361]|nr:hypothetical protein [Bradyrhizobium sp. CCBAU 11361]